MKLCKRGVGFSEGGGGSRGGIEVRGGGVGEISFMERGMGV